jgi:hypothetical protein
LNLGNNLITVLYYDFLRGLTGLKTIFLQSNRLSSLHSSFFRYSGISSPQSTLEYIDLSSNSFTVLYGNVYFSFLPSLKTVYLRSQVSVSLSTGINTYSNFKYVFESCPSLLKIGLDWNIVVSNWAQSTIYNEIIIYCSCTSLSSDTY